MSQPLSAALSQDLYQQGSIFSPLPSGCRLFIGVFAVRLIGAAATVIIGCLRLSPDCGSVHSLAASSSSVSSPLRQFSPRPRPCRPAAAIIVHPSPSEIHPCTRTASFLTSRHAAAAGHPCTRHDAGFSSFPLLLARRSSAPLPSDFPRGRRTDASFEAAGDFERTWPLGPSGHPALRGDGMSTNRTTPARTQMEDRRRPAAPCAALRGPFLTGE